MLTPAIRAMKFFLLAPRGWHGRTRPISSRYFRNARHRRAHASAAGEPVCSESMREIGAAGGRVKRPKRCRGIGRSEEHTSELQALMRNSYAGFCLKKTKSNRQETKTTHQQHEKQQ